MTPSAAAPPPAFSMPLLREAALSDFPAIAALERANGLKSRSYAEWSRFWTENPVYRSLGKACPIGWVLEDEDTGRIVGTLSNVPLPYTFQGQTLLAATGRGWAVDPAYRAFAPMLLDEYINQNADVLLSTTVNGLAEASHTTFEQTRVPVGDWAHAAFRIIDYFGFAKVALRLKNLPQWLSPIAAAGLWIKDRLARTAPLPEKARGVPVDASREFGRSFDDFWMELRAAKVGRLLGVRSREVLEWHFGAYSQSQRLRILTVNRPGGGMSAYCVLVRTDHAGTGLKRMRLADYQTLDPTLSAALIHMAIEVCREEGVHVLELVGCGLPALKDWEAVMPYRRALPAWCYFFHSTDDSLMGVLRDPSAWEPSTFDGDSSI